MRPKKTSVDTRLNQDRLAAKRHCVALASICVHAAASLMLNAASNQMFQMTCGCSKISESHPLLHVSWWLHGRHTESVRYLCRLELSAPLGAVLDV